MPNWVKWLLALGAACIALGAWLLVGDVALHPEWLGGAADYQPEVARLEREYRRTSVLAERVAMLDVVRGLMPDSPRLALELRGDSAAALSAQLAAAAASEYAPAAAPRVPVIIATRPPRPTRSAGRVPGSTSAEYTVTASSGPRADFVAGTDRGAPYCAVSFDALTRLSARWYQSSLVVQPLGPCRLWARYGQPGPDVQNWLAHGAFDFTRDADLLLPLTDTLRGRRIFGVPREQRVGWRLEACLQGDARGCRQALLEPTAGEHVASAPAGVLATDRSYWWWLEPGDPSVHLAAALEAEFGRERFEQFWTSTADVETAFRASFGLPLEAWAMRWLQGVFGRTPAGPRLAAPTLLLSLVTLGLLAAAVVALSRHRTAG